VSAIGFLILAAGASTRMGTPKQLLSYRGHSFLRRITDVALASGCQPVIVVLGANAERIEPEVRHLPIQIVENLQWSDGMGTSIRRGVESLLAFSPTVEAVVIALTDQPLICPQAIEQLINSYRSTNKPIVASQYAGTLGVPALFNRTFFSELMALETAAGAKQVMQKHRQDVFSVPMPHGAIDIDTPKDYEQLLLRQQMSSDPG
jgi:molybdenum cofactor cytidylyltransferase